MPTVINKSLVHEGLPLRGVIIVDATIISAPTSIKHKAEKRDPETSQTKSNEWHFGIKMHLAA